MKAHHRHTNKTGWELGVGIFRERTFDLALRFVDWICRAAW